MSTFRISEICYLSPDLHLLKISCIHEYFCRSSVGTLFALPWFLTWFGHSLNSYRNVVRLYDYFLASPFLMPLYVTAAIVLYREDDIFKEDCDMASLHCLLSQVRKSTYSSKSLRESKLSFSTALSFPKTYHSNICCKMRRNCTKSIHQNRSNWTSNN